MPKQKYYWSKIQKWSGTDKNLRAPKSSTCGTAKSSSYTLATCLLADPQYNSFLLPNLRSCNSFVVDFKIWPQFFSTLVCTCLCIETYCFSTTGGIYFLYSGLALWLPTECGIDDIMQLCFWFMVYIETWLEGCLQNINSCYIWAIEFVAIFVFLKLVYI